MPMCDVNKVAFRHIYKKLSNTSQSTLTAIRQKLKNEYLRMYLLFKMYLLFHKFIFLKPIICHVKQEQTVPVR